MNRKRFIGAAGRYFKLDVKNGSLMLLVYYCLYITYMLTGFLFNLDQSNICRHTQKIEVLIRQCANPTKHMPDNKKAPTTTQEIEKHFPVLMALWIEQQIQSRPKNKKRRRKNLLLRKEKGICY